MVVLQVLHASSSALTINELMQAIKQQVSIPELDSDAQLALFKLNWLIMNALYQLQQDLVNEGLYLYISTLHIQLQALPKTIKPSAELQVDHLRTYYLDWQHYSQTTKEDVDALFDGLWKVLSEPEQLAQARHVLGVTASASASQIKQRYRLLAGQFHPDKGGDTQQFIAIRQAYELLR